MACSGTAFFFNIINFCTVKFDVLFFLFTFLRRFFPFVLYFLSFFLLSSFLVLTLFSSFFPFFHLLCVLISFYFIVQHHFIDSLIFLIIFNLCCFTSRIFPFLPFPFQGYMLFPFLFINFFPVFISFSVYFNFFLRLGLHITNSLPVNSHWRRRSSRNYGFLRKQHKGRILSSFFPLTAKDIRIYPTDRSFDLMCVDTSLIIRTASDETSSPGALPSYFPIKIHAPSFALKLQGVGAGSKWYALGASGN
jgi:hypothetical protein